MLDYIWCQTQKLEVSHRSECADPFHAKLAPKVYHFVWKVNKSKLSDLRDNLDFDTHFCPNHEPGAENRENFFGGRLPYGFQLSGRSK